MTADQDLWRDTWIDTFTGLRASAACADYMEQALTISVRDADARLWLVADPSGREWATLHGFPEPLRFFPDGECTAENPRPILSISSPSENQTVGDRTLEIRGRAGATREFDHYSLEYAEDRDPDDWKPILPSSTTPVSETGTLAEWDLADINDGWLTIRLTVYSKQGGKAELKIRFHLQKPVPTPVPTRTPTATPTVTITPTVTPIPTAHPPAHPRKRASRPPPPRTRPPRPRRWSPRPRKLPRPTATETTPGVIFFMVALPWTNRGRGRGPGCIIPAMLSRTRGALLFFLADRRMRSGRNGRGWIYRLPSAGNLRRLRPRASSRPAKYR